MNGNTAILKDRFWLSAVLISAAVGVLINFPEILSLYGKIENHNLFPGIRFTDVANEIFISFVSVLLLFFANTQVFKFNKSNKVSIGKVLLSFLFCWLLSTVISNLFFLLHTTFNVPAVEATIHHYLHPIRDLIIACVVTGSSYIIHLVKRQQRIVSENQLLRIENIRTQYEALKNQLNPHMLFNSLNTLRSLIREEPVKAQDYTQELSKVLRYTLQSNESKCVPLSEEMEFVEAYMFLLKMRYEDNINFNIGIDNRFSDYLLPPMSLQLLIENAVKHNEISMRRPLTINIFTSGDATISVCNPIQSKITNSAGTGIGLDNLAKRYNLLFQKEIDINTDNERFCICLPLIKVSDYEGIDY